MCRRFRRISWDDLAVLGIHSIYECHDVSNRPSSVAKSPVLMHFRQLYVEMCSPFSVYATLTRCLLLLQYINDDEMTSAISVSSPLTIGTTEEMDEDGATSVPSHETTSSWKMVIHCFSDKILLWYAHVARQSVSAASCPSTDRHRQ